MRALASRAEDKDTIDLAVLGGLKDDTALKDYQVTSFPAVRPGAQAHRSHGQGTDGKQFKVTKGAPQVILELVGQRCDGEAAVDKAVNDFAARGFRSLGVARADGRRQMAVSRRSAAVRSAARGCQGDHRDRTADGREDQDGDRRPLAIAKETAKKLGHGQRISSMPAASAMRSIMRRRGDWPTSIEKADGFAQVFPEHKFHIVDVLQKHGHIVGMTGDGVNDAPALKKADCGIAVSGATDAARAAASIVLMTPGLSVIIDAIKESRRIFQRMNSYAIYRIAETLRVLLFMTLAILIFNFYPLTAVMIVMLALLNDGAILSIAYDNVHYKDKPEAWNMRLVLGIATVLGIVGVIVCVRPVLSWRPRLSSRPRTHPDADVSEAIRGWTSDDLPDAHARTFWSIRPARILLIAVFGTQTMATLIAVYGLFMTPLGWGWAAFVWGYALAWFLVTDRVKLLAYRILDRHQSGAAAEPKARAISQRCNPSNEPMMKITHQDFRVGEGDEVDLKKWPTKIDPVYKSKEQYKKLLEDHVAR